MKKTYEKPVLTKRGNLSYLTSQVVVIVSGATAT